MNKYRNCDNCILSVADSGKYASLMVVEFVRFLFNLYYMTFLWGRGESRESDFITLFFFNESLSENLANSG